MSCALQSQVQDPLHICQRGEWKWRKRSKRVQIRMMRIHQVRGQKDRDSESENIENQAEDVERDSDEEGELNESTERLRNMTEIKDMGNQANVEVSEDYLEEVQSLSRS
ncbi:hypothetical protein XENOCAPTIV_011802 [Xenoophorus captivus]|uniref:Uncharacterized protein n=1 Tax=Xenoophorus captivus TaxID=1517983 RepID=A0ABV0RRM5_9TELE